MLIYCGCRAAAITFYKRYVDARDLCSARFSDLREDPKALFTGCTAYVKALHLLRVELRAVLEWQDRGCNGAIEKRIAVHGYVQRFLAMHVALMAATAGAAGDAEEYHDALEHPGTCCMLCVMSMLHKQCHFVGVLM